MPNDTTAAVEWHDAADPYRGERNLPKNFCLGCGLVSSTPRDDMRHVSSCAEPVERSWHCWACATENWKRRDCRCCGKEAQ